MSRSRQKDTVKDRELVLVLRKVYHEKQEPLRFRLKKIRLVNMDDNLKRIYRIEN